MVDSSASVASAAQSSVTTSQSTTSKTTSETTSGSSTESSGTDFLSYLEKELNGLGKAQISEEDLFAALIEARIAQDKPGALQALQKAKEFYTSALTRSDGYVSNEEVAKGTLQKLVDDGDLTKDEAEKLCGECFAQAQLDTNLDKLYDDRGTTCAVAALDDVLAKFQNDVSATDTASKDYPSRELDYSSDTGCHNFPTIESYLLEQLKTAAESSGEAETETDSSSTVSSTKAAAAAKTSTNSGVSATA